MGEMVLEAIRGINWLNYALAVIIAFPTGALWYAVLFMKPWMRIFHATMPNQMKFGPWFRSFMIQLVTSMMLALLVFILAAFSPWLAFYGMLTISAWQVCEMTFKVSTVKDFFMGMLIEPGYTLVACGIFLLMSQL